MGQGWYRKRGTGHFRKIFGCGGLQETNLYYLYCCMFLLDLPKKIKVNFSMNSLNVDIWYLFLQRKLTGCDWQGWDLKFLFRIRKISLGEKSADWLWYTPPPTLWDNFMLPSVREVSVREISQLCLKGFAYKRGMRKAAWHLSFPGPPEPIQFHSAVSG